jgi:predicted flap endonuclease-1-like 5' DNA nuclease
MIEANWLLVAVVVIIAVLIAVWLLGRASRSAPRVRHHRPDVLDEGAAPAQRNQALIDAPASVSPIVIPPTTAEAMGGLAEVIAVGAAVEKPAPEALVVEDTPAPVSAEPRAEAPVEAPVEAKAEAGDDLGRLKGVGPKLVAALLAMGVTRYAQIAAWSDADIARVDAALPPAFQGRIVRDNWVAQADFLAGGDVAGYESKFGKL